MLIIFLIYALIPILIILRIPRTLDKKIKKCRFKYAIPAIILTLINVSGFLYWLLVNDIYIFEDNQYAYLLPGLSLLLVLIIYASGRKKEKIIQTELTSQEIENVRFKKSSSRRNEIVIGIEEENIENL